MITPAEISWSGTWSAIKAGADERKLRLHAGTNNAEKLERILQLGTVNANASDEHGRTALHIAAAKGRDTIKNTILKDKISTPILSGNLAKISWKSCREIGFGILV